MQSRLVQECCLFESGLVHTQCLTLFISSSFLFITFFFFFFEGTNGWQVTVLHQAAPARWATASQSVASKVVFHLLPKRAWEGCSNCRPKSRLLITTGCSRYSSLKTINPHNLADGFLGSCRLLINYVQLHEPGAEALVFLATVESLQADKTSPKAPSGPRGTPCEEVQAARPVRLSIVPPPRQMESEVPLLATAQHISTEEPNLPVLYMQRLWGAQWGKRQLRRQEVPWQTNKTASRRRHEPAAAYKQCSRPGYRNELLGPHPSTLTILRG